MTEYITFHQLLPDDAREVQRFVYEDTLRVGASPKEARTVADPTNDDMIRKQRDNLRRPPVKGLYQGVDIGDGERRGVVKIGPWLYGDAEMFEPKPYTRKEKVIIELGRWTTRAEKRPVGLHVFAIERGLASTALQAVRQQLVAPTASLKAAVHIYDYELHDAFTTLGAEPDGPVGTKTIGEYEAPYMLRELPSLEQ